MRQPPNFTHSQSPRSAPTCALKWQNPSAVQENYARIRINFYNINLSVQLIIYTMMHFVDEIVETRELSGFVKYKIKVARCCK